MSRENLSTEALSPWWAHVAVFRYNWKIDSSFSFCCRRMFESYYVPQGPAVSGRPGARRRTLMDREFTSPYFLVSNISIFSRYLR